MPAALASIVAALAIAMVSVVVAGAVQRGSNRDAGSKAALAAAEAGVSQVLLHYNRIPTTAVTPCIAANASSVFLSAVEANGWCPAVTGRSGEGSFSYRVMPTDGALEIVSTGTARNASRRVHVDAASVSGQGIFGTATVQAQDHLTMRSNSVIEADLATNGDVTMSSNARICGDAYYGVGRAFTISGNATQTCGVRAQRDLNLPPVNQGDAAAVNDNTRFFAFDPAQGHAGRVTWTGASRQLSLRQNSALTLGGSVYSFCTLEMSSNTTLFVAPGASVTIYFDSPEACGLAPGTQQLSLNSNSRITSSSGAVNVAMLFVGSETVPSSINLSSNTQVAGSCEQNFVIYAPRTAVTLNSNSRYCGAIAAKSIDLDSNSQIYADNSSSGFVLPNVAPHYAPGRFVECTERVPATPDEGC